MNPFSSSETQPDYEGLTPCEEVLWINPKNSKISHCFFNNRCCFIEKAVRDERERIIKEISEFIEDSRRASSEFLEISEGYQLACEHILDKLKGLGSEKDK